MQVFTFFWGVFVGLYVVLFHLSRKISHCNVNFRWWQPHEANHPPYLPHLPSLAGCDSPHLTPHNFSRKLFVSCCFDHTHNWFDRDRSEGNSCAEGSSSGSGNRRDSARTDDSQSHWLIYLATITKLLHTFAQGGGVSFHSVAFHSILFAN